MTGGVIDWDYRGELCVLIYNFGAGRHIFQARDRCAQLIIIPSYISRIRRPDIQVHEVDALDVTDRGEGGFGSSGKRANEYVTIAIAPEDIIDENQTVVTSAKMLAHLSHYHLVDQSDIDFDFELHNSKVLADCL